MKIKTAARLALILTSLISAAFAAAPLDKATAVYARPDASSPTLTILKPGANLAPSTGTNAPAGWTAITLAGPHTVYAQNKDLTKSLDLRQGAQLHVAPKLDSAILTTAALAEPAEITGLHGKWTQLSLPRTVVGYIQSSTTPVTSAPVSTNTAANASLSQPLPSLAPPSAAPATPAAQGLANTNNTTGRAVPMVNLGDGGSSALPRLFQGKFASSRKAFAPRRPFEFQLNDSAGERYAYLDLSKVLLTEQIEKYIDHTVAVYGTAKPIPGSKDIVIAVESLQLR